MTVSSPRSVQQKQIQDISKNSQAPDPIGLRVTHGLISAINNNSQVQVKPLDGNEEVLGGKNAWHAVIPETAEIQRRWGQLRVGMFCRAYWTGKVSARHVYYVEILGKEMIVSKKQALDNDIDNNHFGFLSGGGWGSNA